MKKVLLSMLMIFSAVLMGSQIFAEEATTGKGNVVIHYQNTSGDYSNLGLHTWDHGSQDFGGEMRLDSLPTLTKTDGFGVYWELNDITIKETGNFGWMITSVKSDTEFWGEKYANHEIQWSDLTVGKTTHVYIFQGSNTRTNNEGLEKPIPYLVTNPELYNSLITYYDSSGAYPENIGVHGWGWETFAEPKWGIPHKLLQTVGLDNTGTPILGGMAGYTADQAPGLLIYDGSNKKTGDIPFKPEEAKGLGEADVAQVLNAGDGNESGDNVFVNNAEGYISEAYTFKFVPMYYDDSGMLTGTFAPSPNQVMVQFNQNVTAPVAAKPLNEEDEEVELTDEEKEAIVRGWFTIKDDTGKVVEIEKVDFNKVAKSLESFVLILKTNLDNTKVYTLTANIDEDHNISIELDLDNEAPVFTFLSPSDFQTEKDGDKRIILVAWDKKFDQNLFPRFTVRDNRDGDVTSLVHVPKGDFSKINTNVMGDYKIMLRVSDDWGNVTEETFIFRVTKKVK